MFEAIKEKIWTLLRSKEVSLAMLYSRDGQILWHLGREVRGKSVHEGEGFSKSLIIQTLSQDQTVEMEDIAVTYDTVTLPASAKILRVKSIIIQPIGNHYFLYIDSGAEVSFNQTDREIFKVIGHLLGEMIQTVRKSQRESGGLTGESEKIEGIRDLVLRYSIEEQPVLLLGETGVGKSRVAEMIHRNSGRKGELITVNTPAIPEQLFESEIFGHKKGAFTDARSDKKGYVDLAQKGTLFFDEIAEVPLAFQAKLLRFIETKKYQSLGNPEEKTAEVRILAATNRDLNQAIRDGRFRQDLYFRLQILEIEIPPLRERPDDIARLVEENLDLLRGKTIAKDFWEVIRRHDWPGNVRELITVLTRAGIQLPGPITGKDIAAIIESSRHPGQTPPDTGDFEPLWRRIRGGGDFWDTVWRPFISRELNRREVKAFLVEGYRESDHSLKRLSELLNIGAGEFKKFIALLHKYRIHPGKPED